VPFDVVIAGGGFGGLYAARRLEPRPPRHSARITVVSDVNFLLYLDQAAQPGEAPVERTGEV
jgi:NADH dehydrogenase